MLYHLLYPLKYIFSPFNVFGYITFRTMAAVFISIMISYLFGKRFIVYLRNKKISQNVRSDGPQTHLSKSNTPTMGGVIILVSLVLSILFCARLDNRFILWCIAGILWFGFLGFMDDYLKLIKHNSKGLNAKFKLLGQMLFATAFSAYVYLNPSNPQYATMVNVPYLKDVYINMGIMYLLFSIIVIVGSSNAVNITDGLDGLAVGCLMIASFTYAIFSYVAGHAQLSQYLKVIPIPGAGELTIVLAAMVGSCLGFLWFNGYPAEVFMGDTGSLFLGGLIGVIAVIIKQELLLVVVGGVFVVEILSVVLQVYSFKRYKKRVFLMAPIHHHFELKGLAESKVTIRLWIVSFILTLIALSSLKLR